MATNKHYTELIKRIRAPHILGSVGGLLSWDQEVMMPAGGADHRAEQSSVVASLGHELFTSKRIGTLLKKLETAVLDEDQRAVVREVKRDYERAVKVPQSLVEELARVESKAQVVWIDAKAKSDFSLFAPYLERIVDLKRQYAKAIDPAADPYEVLFQDYEAHMPLAQASANLRDIRDALVPLIKRISMMPQPDTKVLRADIPDDVQLAFNKKVAGAIGYDFSKGRLDISAHPFTTDAGDVRITTRFTDGPVKSLLSTIHESGHAMYEQGLPEEHYGTPLCSAGSLSIHESQSRLWENHVGRARPFWKHFLPIMQKAYAPALAGLGLDTAVRAMNVVKPGLIRVNADEATYNLHIILRFELEKELIGGRLAVRDLPAAWNAKMQELLGITPADDAQGVLQDVHWSCGLFGYFPTYSMGSMIAAQLYAKAKKDMPDLESRFERGDFSSMLAWLRRNIHAHGRKYPTDELVRRATGSEPRSDEYIAYLTEKFSALYGF